MLIDTKSICKIHAQFCNGNCNKSQLLLRICHNVTPHAKWALESKMPDLKNNLFSFGISLNCKGKAEMRTCKVIKNNDNNKNSNWWSSQAQRTWGDNNSGKGKKDTRYKDTILMTLCACVSVCVWLSNCAWPLFH